MHIGSADQLQDAVSKHAPDAHVLVMAAAVADFRPDPRGHHQDQEVRRAERRDAPSIELTRTDDVLAGAVRARTDGQLPNMRAIVGFAAETGDANGDVLFHARAKLQRKGCDLLVVNAVGEGRAFEVDNNDGWLLAADGTEVGAGARFEDVDGQPYRGRDRGLPAAAAAGDESATATRCA